MFFTCKMYLSSMSIYLVKCDGLRFDVLGLKTYIIGICAI